MQLYIFHTLFFLLLNLILHLRKIQIIEFSFVGLSWLLLSWLSVMVCVAAIDLTTRPLRPRILRSLAFYIYWLIYLFVFIYHYRARDILDYSLIGDNISLLFYGESAVVVGAFYKTKDYFMYVGLFLLNLYFWRKYHIFQYRASTKWLVPALLAAILVLWSFPFNFYDELGQFAQSVNTYYRSESTSDIEKKILKENPYPYKIDAPLLKPKDPPNIVLLPIESFNANFVETKTPEGKEFTPYMNELVQRGVYVEHYFGNTVQTAKGHFAILCGVLPLTSGKVATRFSENNFHCLPEIMHDLGYLTFYFQAHKQLTFDNKEKFMKAMGFDVVATVDTTKLSEDEQKKYVWGWGAQDDIMYKQGFDMLDTLIAKQKKPVLFMMQGVASHMMFNNVPKEQRELYPDQNTREQNYANAIHVTDRYLRTFFEELQKRDYMKNTIVVITGDHSFPVGEHGIYHNERSFYNEFFKTPLLILWPEKLKPARIDGRNASHLDIGPTLLDLIGSSSPNHFLGRSIFSKDKTPPPPIALVQPYAGKYLGIVDGEFKFVQNMRTGRTYLFNLKDDPQELHNLSGNDLYQPIVERMRQALSLFRLNDVIIQKNLLYPN